MHDSCARSPRPGAAARPVVSLAARAILALGLIGGPGALFGQPATHPTSQQGGSNPNKDQSNPSNTPEQGIMLRSEPTSFQALGVSLRLPLEALIETTALGASRQSVGIQPPDKSWHLSVEERVSRDRTLTPGSVAAEMIKELRDSRSRVETDASGRQKVVGSKVELLGEPREALVGGRAAARFVVQSPRADDTTLATAYAIVAREPGRFLVFTLSCLPPELARASRAFDAILGGAAFPDATDVLANRATSVTAGDDFLANLTRERIDAALPEGARWYRIYRPAPTGAPGDAVEIAYQKLEIRRGARADLDPRRAPARAGEAPEADGYIVRSVARYVEKDRVVDSESVFFANLLGGVGEARDEEAWTIRMGIKEKKDTSIWTETGARQGNRLSVRVAPPAAAPTEKQWLAPDKAYLSQVLTHMLPRLLARSATPMTYSFYAYNSSAGDVSLRRESIEPGSAGGWVLRTRMGEGVAERVSYLDDRGELIRTEMGDGTIVEPIEVARLQALWKSKGLPTD